MEKRAYCNLELRSNSEAGKPSTLTGYVLKYNSDSDPIKGAFIEQIAPGAVVLRSNILALYWHKEADILGSTQGGTLRFTNDDIGLAVECDLPDTQRGHDVAEYVRRGDIKGWSFGFDGPIKDSWQRAKPLDRRTLRSFELVEVSVTPLPYYPDTTIALRSRELWDSQELFALKMRLDLASRI